jgi:RNA 2',3'-cyclic 3'-phosphodiesterase
LTGQPSTQAEAREIVFEQLNMADSAPTDRLRLFIALPIPESVKTRIVEAQSELRRHLREAPIRWTKPEQLHLTLRFLGNVGVDQCPALTDAVQAACQRFGALTIQAASIGCFPNARSPRVLWAGAGDAHGQLPELRAAINEAVGEFTAEAAEGKFIGHATLGRIQHLRRREAEMLAQLSLGMAARSFGSWEARAVEIMQSELSPQGAQYSTFATIPLPGPPD